jgi:hypothetical protein
MDRAAIVGGRTLQRPCQAGNLDGLAHVGLVNANDSVDMKE